MDSISIALGLVYSDKGQQQQKICLKNVKIPTKVSQNDCFFHLEVLLLVSYAIARIHSAIKNDHL
jgi:hypothetical protein